MANKARLGDFMQALPIMMDRAALATRVDFRASMVGDAGREINYRACGLLTARYADHAVAAAVSVGYQS